MRLWLRKLLPRKMAHQVTFAVSLIVAGAIGATSLYFIYENLVQKLGTATKGLHSVAANLAYMGAPSMLTGEYGRLADTLLLTARYPGILAIQAVDVDHRVRLEVQNNADADPALVFSRNKMLSPPSSLQDGSSTSPPDAKEVRAGVASLIRNPKLIIWHPIENGELGWIRIDADLQDITEEALHGLEDGLLAALIATLTAIAIVYPLFAYQFRAVSTLTGFARKLTENRGEQLQIASSSMELEALAVELNHASRQLHEDSQALQDSHTQTSAMLRNLKDVIVSTDDRGIIESVNPAVYYLLGYMDFELIGQDAEIIIPQQYRHAHHLGMQRYIDEGEAHILGKNVPIEALHKDGHTVPVRLALTEFWIGSNRHFAATLYDRTDEINLQKTELARQSAEAANRSKTEFLAHMSHEVRTPMNGVLGMLDVLLKTNLNEHQLKLANIIRDSAHTQLGVLNDILDFSKVEAGKLTLSRDAFDLRQMLADFISAMEFHARQQHVELQLEVTPDVPRFVLGDALRIRQILGNLISNAIKFSSSKPNPHVLLHVLLSEPHDQQRWIAMNVVDNGVGIDPEVQRRLFTPFTQADSSTTKKFGGTGLGLSIAQRLAQLMGGGIAVDSTPGKGSAFTVTLPLDVATEEMLETAAGSPQETLPQPFSPSGPVALPGHLRILVAEDNETNQQVILEQLTLLGHDADVAPDGREALKRWQTGDYALVLSDIHMPHMDGHQLASAIRDTEAKEHRPRTPLVAISADVIEDHVLFDELQDGFDEQLTKPVSLSELSKTLAKFLRPHDVDASPLAPSVASAPVPTSPPPPAIVMPQPQSGEDGLATFPLWDPDALTQMVGDDPAMHVRFLKKFLANATDRRTAIESAVQQGDVAEAGAQAHALKSAARTVGAMRLGEVCHALEKAGKQGDTASCQQLFADFIRQLDVSRAEIEKHLG